MAVCYKYVASPILTRVSGTFLISLKKGSLLIDWYNRLKADFIPLLPSGTTVWSAVVYMRPFIKSEWKGSFPPSTFPGAVPRYKIGRFNWINSDFYYDTMFMSYVNQTLPSAWTIITDQPKLDFIEFFQCTVIQSDKLFVAPSNNYFGAYGTEWTYATDTLLDLEANWGAQLQLGYWGFITPGLYSPSTTGYLNLNI